MKRENGKNSDDYFEMGLYWVCRTDGYLNTQIIAVIICGKDNAESQNAHAKEIRKLCRWILNPSLVNDIWWTVYL